MKCNQICEHNGFGSIDRCVRPSGMNCPMVMTAQEFDQQAKADGGKLQIHLVPMQIVRDISEVRMYGTEKYGDPENWRKVELMRYVDAMLRHTLAFVEDIHGVDEESGIPHYKHAECNWAFISEMMKERK